MDSNGQQFIHNGQQFIHDGHNVFVAWGNCKPIAISSKNSSFLELAYKYQSDVIAYRRHVHEFPELGNQEYNTAAYISNVLHALGVDVVDENVAFTGIRGVILGNDSISTNTVALRADMDGLTVKEETGLEFASVQVSTWNGVEVPVAQACGHDSHVAMLLGVAHVLTELRAANPAEFHGNYMLIFQPAEEGTEFNMPGGAELMLEEGLFDDPYFPSAVFGLHVGSELAVGEIGYANEGCMASTDRFEINVKGVQTHAAYPWTGSDTIGVAARIVLALQEISARRVDVRLPSVITVGILNSGIRNNIIPDTAYLEGTIRSLDAQQRLDLHSLIQSTVSGICVTYSSALYQLDCSVEIFEGYPVTYNNPELVEASIPSLQITVGEENVHNTLPSLGGEDFAYYGNVTKGFFYWLGARPPSVPPAEYPTNHSPYFTIDEDCMPFGVASLVQLAIDHQNSIIAQAQPGVKPH